MARASLCADCAANDRGDGLGFDLANALGRAATALVAVHHLVRNFMRERGEFLRRRLAEQYGDHPV